MNEQRTHVIEEIIEALSNAEFKEVNITSEIIDFLENMKKEIFISDLLTSERREDMLVGALEGGSNYWYQINQTSSDIIQSYDYDINNAFATNMIAAVNAGESLAIHDYDNPDELLGMFNLESIRKGESLMKEQEPRHWANILDEKDDAETSDVWFQYCVLGDIVFG